MNKCDKSMYFESKTPPKFQCLFILFFNATGPIPAFSRIWQSDGTFIWGSCQVLQYNNTSNMFLIRFQDTRHEKEVARFNLRFGDERPEEYEARLEKAQKLRQNGEKMLAQRTAIEALAMKEERKVPESQKSRIFELCNFALLRNSHVEDLNSIQNELFREVEREWAKIQCITTLRALHVNNLIEKPDTESDIPSCRDTSQAQVWPQDISKESLMQLTELFEESRNSLWYNDFRFHPSIVAALLEIQHINFELLRNASLFHPMLYIEGEIYSGHYRPFHDRPRTFDENRIACTLNELLDNQLRQLETMTRMLHYGWTRDVAECIRFHAGELFSYGQEQESADLTGLTEYPQVTQEVYGQRLLRLVAFLMEDALQGVIQQSLIEFGRFFLQDIQLASFLLKQDTHRGGGNSEDSFDQALSYNETTVRSSKMYYVPHLGESKDELNPAIKMGTLFVVRVMLKERGEKSTNYNELTDSPQTSQSKSEPRRRKSTRQKSSDELELGVSHVLVTEPPIQSLINVSIVIGDRGKRRVCFDCEHFSLCYSFYVIVEQYVIFLFFFLTFSLHVY